MIHSLLSQIKKAEHAKDFILWQLGHPGLQRPSISIMCNFLLYGLFTSSPSACSASDAFVSGLFIRPGGDRKSRIKKATAVAVAFSLFPFNDRSIIMMMAVSATMAAAAADADPRVDRDPDRRSIRNTIICARIFHQYRPADHGVGDPLHADHCPGASCLRRDKPVPA